MNIEAAYERLKSVLGSALVKRDELMSNHVYTKIGGQADLFVTPETYEQTVDIIKVQREFDLPFMLLGNGSNLIVRDGGVRGLVLSFEKLKSITVSGTSLTAQAGADIIEASREALTYSLTGLEFACGIPGTVGGAMVMNAGAYGGEVKDVIDHVTVVTPEAEILKLSKNELELDYQIGRAHV